MQNERYTWDFFIAHASTDALSAEALYDLLSPKSRVFLDSRCLELGGDWDKDIASAQRQAFITIVLISSHTESAYYQREEIAAAISLARKNEKKYRVVPIFLNTDNSTENDIPYGLELKHGITVPENVAFDVVAERLLNLLDSLLGFAEWLKYAPKPPILPEGKNWHVFLSYRPRHSSWALKLCEAFSKARFKVYNAAILQPGENVVLSLEKAFNESTSSISIWSFDSEDWSWNEWHYEQVKRRKSDENSDFRFMIITLEKDQLPLFAKQTVRINEDPDGPSSSGLLRLMYSVADILLPLEVINFIERTTHEVQAELNKIDAARIIGDSIRLKELGAGSSMVWLSSPLLSCHAVNALIELGKYDEALGVLNSVDEYFPQSIRAKQLRSLALANMGQILEAQLAIAGIFAGGNKDLNTLLILGYTWMCRYKESKKRIHLERSRVLYKEAFTISPENYYAVIKSAALSILLGEKEVAYDYIGKVEERIKNSSASQNYLAVATFAEMRLIQEDYKEAARFYKEAILIDPEAIGLHQDSLTDARMLMETLKTPSEMRLQVEQILEQ